MLSIRRAAVGLASCLALSCGGPDVRGTIDQLGGEACVPDRKVCLVVPPQALDAPISVKISPATELPPAALGDGWQISAVGKPALVFLAPAQVVYSLDKELVDSVPSVNLLRVYRRSDAGDWETLSHAVIDRVKEELSGETLVLGDFVPMRVDRLPDGGLPIQGDGGVKDGGSVIIIPPRPDAGRPDAGTPDAGAPDAGPADAGPVEVDAGTPDAGVLDAGTVDAGAPDAGAVDAGATDAGGLDAGFDAGAVDAGDDAGLQAGVPDAGGDAGTLDAGANDGG